MIKAFQIGASKTGQKITESAKMQSTARVQAEQKLLVTNENNVLTRFSVAIGDAPEKLTGSDESDRRHTKNPQNVVSGVGYGIQAAGYGFWDGFSGVVTQPYKGAKKDGAKGLAKGMGKGLIGLVAKPASGLVGFFGHTVQGAANTPGTIKRAVDEKKSKKNQEANAQEETKNPQTNGQDVGEMEEFDEEDLRTMEPMVNVNKSEIANYQQEKDQIHEQIKQLQNMANKDDPLVQQKFEELLALTAKPEHIRQEHRMSLA